MIKKIDKLGRVVIPKDYIRALEINENDEVEITLKGGEIAIKKSISQCVFFGSDLFLIKIKHLHACTLCIKDMNEIKSLFKISIAAVFWSNLCSAASKTFVLRQ